MSAPKGQPEDPRQRVTKGVVRVGGGRGFVINYRQEIGGGLARNCRLVVTAAHCLRRLPPANVNAYEERTYKNLLGSLNDKKPKVWAHCLFADPVGDVAVLGAPDDEVFYEEAEAYEALTGAARLVRLGKVPPQEEFRVWLLSLDRQWFPCNARHFAGGWALATVGCQVKGGMSGSPILADDGRAIALTTSGAEPSVNPDGDGMASQTLLALHLPAWLRGTRRRVR